MLLDRGDLILELRVGWGLYDITNFYDYSIFRTSADFIYLLD